MVSGKLTFSIVGGGFDKKKSPITHLPTKIMVYHASRTPTHRTKREKEKIIDSKAPAGSGFMLGTLEKGNGSPTAFFEKA